MLEKREYESPETREPSVIRCHAASGSIGRLGENNEVNGSAAPPSSNKTPPDLRDETEQRGNTWADCVDDRDIGCDSRPRPSPCPSRLSVPARAARPVLFDTILCVCKRCVSNGSAPASHSFANPPKPSFRQAIVVLPTTRPSHSRYSRSGRCHGHGYCQLHAARWQLRLALPRIALPCLAYIASKPSSRPVSVVQPNWTHRTRNPARLQQYGKPVLIDNTHAPPKPKSEGGRSMPRSFITYYTRPSLAILVIRPSLRGIAAPAR